MNDLAVKKYTIKPIKWKREFTDDYQKWRYDHPLVSFSVSRMRGISHNGWTAWVYQYCTASSGLGCQHTLASDEKGKRLANEKLAEVLSPFLEECVDAEPTKIEPVCTCDPGHICDDNRGHYSGGCPDNCLVHKKHNAVGSWFEAARLSSQCNFDTKCVDCEASGICNSCDTVDGRCVEAVSDYAYTCDSCGELTHASLLKEDPETNLGYCPNCYI